MHRVHPYAFSLHMFEGTRVFYFLLFPRVVFEPRPYEWGESVILHFGWEFTLCYADKNEETKRLIRGNGMRKRKGIYEGMEKGKENAYTGEWMRKKKKRRRIDDLGGIESLESGQGSTWTLYVGHLSLYLIHAYYTLIVYFNHMHCILDY